MKILFRLSCPTGNGKKIRTLNIFRTVGTLGQNLSDVFFSEDESYTEELRELNILDVVQTRFSASVMTEGYRDMYDELI